MSTELLSEVCCESVILLWEDESTSPLASLELPGSAANAVLLDECLDVCDMLAEPGSAVFSSVIAASSLADARAVKEFFGPQSVDVCGKLLSQLLGLEAFPGPGCKVVGPSILLQTHLSGSVCCNLEDSSEMLPSLITAKWWICLLRSVGASL
jgi:hypothetical protein